MCLSVILCLVLVGNQQEVVDVLDRLTSAGLKRDVAALDQLYADDYFHTNADGSRMSKQDVLKSYRDPPTALVESSAHDEDRVQVHGDLAIISSRIKIAGRIADQPFTRSYRVTYVFRKAEGRWLVATSHASLLAQ